MSQLRERGQRVEIAIRQALHNTVFCTPAPSSHLNFSSMANLVGKFFMFSILSLILKLGIMGEGAIRAAPCFHCLRQPLPLQARLLLGTPAPRPIAATPITAQPRAQPRNLFSSGPSVPSSTPGGQGSPPGSPHAPRPSKRTPAPYVPPVRLEVLKRPGVPPDESARCPHCRTRLFAAEAGHKSKVIVLRLHPIAIIKLR